MFSSESLYRDPRRIALLMLRWLLMDIVKENIIIMSFHHQITTTPKIRSVFQGSK